ncbi:MAG: SGNH/GDSL hydrolase family protein, partial [Myxococcota bacterium]|nr:SGNH/GDSL hydrolase family protein [Myxococcota bacterium]
MARLTTPKKIVFSVLVTAGGLLAAEAAATWLYSAELRAWESPPPSPQKGVSVMQGNPYLLYEYPPGEHYERGVAVRINSLAMRGPEPEIPKPAGTLRFITTGDSSVFGFGVAEEAVFSSVAAQRLGDGVEAIIGAVPGYSSFQSINLLRMRALQTEPDLLVIANIWSDNNFDSFVDKDVLAQTAGFAAGPSARLQRLLSNSAVFRVADWKLRVRGSAERVQKVAWQQDSQSRGQIGVRRVEINDYAANLESLAGIAREHGSEVLFVVLANNEDVGGNENAKAGPKAWDPYRAVMRDTAARHGAPVLEVPSLFQASGKTSGELFLDEMHPTTEGHRLMGEALADILTERGWTSGGSVQQDGDGTALASYEDPFVEGTAAQSGPAGDGPPQGQAGGTTPTAGGPPSGGALIEGLVRCGEYEEGFILLEAIAADSGPNPTVLANIKLQSGDARFSMALSEAVPVKLRAYLDADADGPDADDRLFDL